MFRRFSSIALALLLSCSTGWSQDEPSIGYASVAEALEALSEDPDVTVRQEEDWTIAESQEGDDIILWTFTSSIHAAHPSAVKRIVYRKDGDYMLEMMVLCEAEQDDCDELVSVFQELNKSMQK